MYILISHFKNTDPIEFASNDNSGSQSNANIIIIPIDNKEIENE